MTYITKARPQRRRRTGALGGLAEDVQKAWESVAGNSRTQAELACLDEGNAKAAGIDAEIRNLNLNWNPTGFYTPDEMMKITSEVTKVISKANDLVRAAPLSTSDAREVANNAIKLAQEKSVQALNYSKAVAEARANGVRSISAPGLKQWAVSSMQAASHSVVTAGVLECNMTWLASAIIAFQRVFDVAASVVKRIAGVVIKVGELVLDVVEEAPDIAKKLLFVAKWGGLAFVAAFALKKIKEASGR